MRSPRARHEGHRDVVEGRTQGLEDCDIVVHEAHDELPGGGAHNRSTSGEAREATRGHGGQTSVIIGGSWHAPAGRCGCHALDVERGGPVDERRAAAGQLRGHPSYRVGLSSPLCSNKALCIPTERAGRRRGLRDSSVSSEDEVRRRRGTAKDVVLDEAPSAVDFRKWVAHVQMKTCASLKRDGKRTLISVREVEMATRIEDLENSSKRWVDLDTALAASDARVPKSPL